MFHKDYSIRHRSYPWRIFWSSDPAKQTSKNLWLVDDTYVDVLWTSSTTWLISTPRSSSAFLPTLTNVLTWDSVSVTSYRWLRCQPSNTLLLNQSGDEDDDLRLRNTGEYHKVKMIRSNELAEWLIEAYTTRLRSQTLQRCWSYGVSPLPSPNVAYLNKLVTLTSPQRGIPQRRWFCEH